MPKTGHAGWGRSGHRRAVFVGGLVALLVLGGGAAAWAEVSSGSTGYRMASVTRADLGTTLTVVGNVEPVSDASAAFGVGGQVTSVTVSPGQQVSAGQTLAALDTTAMNESVSSDQSTLAADEAKLAEDEASQSSAAASSSSSASPSSPSSSSSSASPPKGSSGPGSSSTTTTTTASPGRGSGSGGQGGSNPVVTKDQTTLTQDEAALSKDQQKQAADLVQAQSDCTSANTATPAGRATCESALETVSADEQVVSTDQSTVSKDETALGQALAGESSGTGTGSALSASSAAASSGSSSTAHIVADLTSAVTGNTGAGSTGSGGSSSTGAGSSNLGGGSPTGGGSSANTDTPQQIASDQSAIDTAEANLTEARQSLGAATLTSPINGTVVSVGINVGDTVSANSSTEIITIIGTNAYEAQATLDSSQVSSVKVGQSAAVEVDGVNGTLEGTVAQVGPVQSSSSGYTYPVVVALPATSGSLHAGSAANVVISTGEVSNVVAVPTSAVQSLGTRSYVLELLNGQLTRKVITVGMVGDTYTQVLSGLAPGQSVVLVDYAEAVPSSNSNTTSNLGSFLGGGGGGAFRAPIFGGGGGGFGGGARLGG